MRKWRVVDDKVGNLQTNLNDLERKGYTIYKIASGVYGCLIIAYKEIIPKNQPSLQGDPTIIKLDDKS